jgi:hypothetical protein
MCSGYFKSKVEEQDEDELADYHTETDLTMANSSIRRFVRILMDVLNIITMKKKIT